MPTITTNDNGRVQQRKKKQKNANPIFCGRTFSSSSCTAVCIGNCSQLVMHSPFGHLSPNRHHHRAYEAKQNFLLNGTNSNDLPLPVIWLFCGCRPVNFVPHSKLSSFHRGQYSMMRYVHLTHTIYRTRTTTISRQRRLRRRRHICNSILPPFIVVRAECRCILTVRVNFRGRNKRIRKLQKNNVSARNGETLNGEWRHIKSKFRK